MTPNQLFAELETASHMVVATHGRQSPEAAVVSFSYDEALGEIYFASESTTRKIQNILKNPRVALVIGWGSWTAQLEGEADILDGDDRERVIQIHIKRNPGSSKYASLPTQRYVRVKIDWARFTDFRNGEAIHAVQGLKHD